jgi:hypothetical protein
MEHNKMHALITVHIFMRVYTKYVRKYFLKKIIPPQLVKNILTFYGILRFLHTQKREKLGPIHSQMTTVHIFITHFCITYLNITDRDSAVDIATGYGLDGPRIESL